MKKLILASASPRRKELLDQIGLETEIIISNTDERTEAAAPEQIVCELAERKCMAAVRHFLSEKETAEDSFVLGADTIVVHQENILGKPADPAEAADMLRTLQGDTHQVYTGVCIVRCHPKTDRADCSCSEKQLFSVCTDVTVAPMTEEEIRQYIFTGEPMDKAGAYGIQGRFARHVQAICGDYTNVVGLPVSAVYQTLRSMHFFDR